MGHILCDVFTHNYALQSLERRHGCDADVRFEFVKSQCVCPAHISQGGRGATICSTVH